MWRLANAKHFTICCLVSAAIGKIIKGAFGDSDNVIGNELCAFARAVLRVFQAAFPLDNRPTIKVIGRHLGKDRRKIDLSITKGPEPSCPIYPRLIARINPLPTGWIKLCVFDMEHLDPILVDVDVIQIIHALKHVMRWVIKHVASGVAIHPFKKHFKGGPVMQVFAWVYLIANVDVIGIGMVEDRTPPVRQFVKR